MALATSRVDTSNDQSPMDKALAAALSALGRLSRAIAVVGERGELVFGNAAFRQMFGTEWQGELAGFIAAADGERAETRQLTLRDGRVVSVESATLAEGLLISAEEVIEAAPPGTDPVTGLHDRATFKQCLSRAASDPAATVAVLGVNLDRFKTINQSLGHAVGDALLRMVGDRMRSALAAGDVAARFAADEFGILQVGAAQPSGAASLAARLTDLLARTYIVEGNLINIGASIGITVAADVQRDAETLLRGAELALRRAKSEGAGRFRFFEPAMDEEVQKRRALEIDFRRALALRELSLAYQPQLDLATRSVTGCEALLRWNNDKRGSVSPAEFIPLAEETGLIVPIGEWVIRTACKEAVKWPAHMKVAVNVSAVQFASPNLVPAVISALADSGLGPGRLELEITESVLIGDHSAALEVLHRLREIGVGIAMDDFGTGYSSLSYLRSFPFDKIKIDQSFVRGPAADESGMAIVSAIAALGQSLGMKTIAEGVETEAQLARIAADGCGAAQGYLISRPLPPEAVAGFFETFANEAAPAPAA